MTAEVVSEVPTGMVSPWWAILIRGIIAIIFGFVAILWPGLTVFALVLVFGIFVIVEGLFSLAATYYAAKAGQRWWTVLLRGLVEIAVGIIVLVWPGITALALLFLIAAWALISGIIEVVGAFSSAAKPYRALLAISGVISIIIGILLFSWPVGGAVAIVWLIGIYAIVIGILLFIFSFDVRKATKAA